MWGQDVTPWTLVGDEPRVLGILAFGQPCASSLGRCIWRVNMFFFCYLHSPWLVI